MFKIKQTLLTSINYFLYFNKIYFFSEILIVLFFTQFHTIFSSLKKEKSTIDKNKSIATLRSFLFKYAKNGSFSKKAFFAIQLPTIIIIRFLLIQISTSFLITDAISVLKYIMPQFKTTRA